MVGLHLLLSPAGTVVKPTCPSFARRPNPIQEGRVECSVRSVGQRVFHVADCRVVVLPKKDEVEMECV